MRYRVAIATGLLFASLPARAFLGGADQTLPVENGRPIVATVNAESITLDAFVVQLEPQADRTQVLQGYGRATDFELLDRLVNVRLIVQEAATMGLADDPDIQKQVEVMSRAILRDVLLERVVKDVTPDPAAVETMFKELAREWKTASLLFQDEAAATRAREEIVGGGTFAEVAARAVASKVATTDADTAYHARKDYLPQVAEAIGALPVGQVSPVIKLQAGFVLVTVLDLRYPDSTEVRAEARRRVLTAQQSAVLQDNDTALRRDYVTVHKDVLDGLDYLAEKPGLKDLLADTRAVADIKGAPPVTVGDLTDYLRMQSFHGSDPKAQGKRMNAAKDAALDATLGRRVLNQEALKRGLDKTPEYRDRVQAYQDSLVFDAFVKKVIVPDSKMTEEEVQRHYTEHLKDFASPEMVRIRSLAFTDRHGAEEAMRKLQEGADFGWLVANADGQADKGREGLLALDGRPVTTDSMPEDVRKAVTGAKAGEFRLYASADGPAYVLAIQAVIAAEAKPYEDVRDEIAKKLYGQKVAKNVEEYLGKLRAASTIEIHLKKAQ